MSAGLIMIFGIVVIVSTLFLIKYQEPGAGLKTYDDEHDSH